MRCYFMKKGYISAVEVLEDGIPAYRSPHEQNMFWIKPLAPSRLKVGHVSLPAECLPLERWQLDVSVREQLCQPYLLGCEMANIGQRKRGWRRLLIQRLLLAQGGHLF